MNVYISVLILVKTVIVIKYLIIKKEKKKSYAHMLAMLIPRVSNYKRTRSIAERNLTLVGLQGSIVESRKPDETKTSLEASLADLPLFMHRMGLVSPIVQPCSKQKRLIARKNPS